MSSSFTDPGLYDCAFLREDEEEFGFYGSFFPRGSRLFSLGSGSGSVECTLAKAFGFEFVGVDSSPQMVAKANGLAEKLTANAPRFEVGILPELPKVDSPFDGAISPLLTLSYLTIEADWSSLFSKLSVALKPGASVLLDVLLHENPLRYQGIIERGPNHQFEFYDVLSEQAFFSVISTELRYWDNPEEPVTVNAPMALVHPRRFIEWIAQTTAFRLEAFYAPHDLESACDFPPLDARRGICLLRLAV
ncbi:MAG: class I SAM-dependent methyltransferase [Sumerlaeia bacterium]